MDHNNILAVVLAGGKSKRFGEDKSQAKLGEKILIDYILSELILEYAKNRSKFKHKVKMGYKSLKRFDLDLNCKKYYKVISKFI